MCSPKERPPGLPEIPKEAVDEAYRKDLKELVERLRDWGIKNERIILEICDPLE